MKKLYEIIHDTELLVLKTASLIFLLLALRKLILNE